MKKKKRATVETEKMKRRIPPRRDPESVSEWGRERSYRL